MKEFDCVIIGGGPGGMRLRSVLRRKDYRLRWWKKRRSAELSKLGMYSHKSLLHAADVLRQTRDAKALGVSIKGVDIDLAQMVKQSRDAANQLSKESPV